MPRRERPAAGWPVRPSTRAARTETGDALRRRLWSGFERCSFFERTPAERCSLTVEHCSESRFRFRTAFGQSGCDQPSSIRRRQDAGGMNVPARRQRASTGKPSSSHGPVDQTPQGQARETGLVWLPRASPGLPTGLWTRRRRERLGSPSLCAFPGRAPAFPRVSWWHVAGRGQGDGWYLQGRLISDGQQSR